MSRRARRLDLTLLLVVAPLIGACDDEVEEPHCVSPNGIYVDPRQCESTRVGFVSGTHWVYVPHSYYSGVGSHAGSFVSATTRGSSSSISRGGFGSIGAGHAGGE